MLFAILVLLTALVVLSPYIVILRKRYKMLKRLTAISEKYGFRVRCLHKLVLLSLNTGKKYDILFENRKCAYAVKLWSAAKKEAQLIANPDGRFFLTSTAVTPLNVDGNKAERSVRSRIYTLSPTQNNVKVKKGKPVISILLYYPQYKGVFLTVDKRRIRITDGSKLFDKIVCSPAYFERIMQENCDIPATNEQHMAFENNTKEVFDAESEK